MDEGFASPTGIDWKGGNVGVVQYGGGDKGMLAMFYTKAHHNPAKSTEAGRPVYDDVVFIRVHPPGERLNIVDRPANESDKQRWPLQWNQFQQHREQIPDGTPVDLLYPEHPSIGAMLRSHGVYTVEQCAELSGPAIDSIGMGAQRYSNDAQKYLQAANKGVKASQLRHELDERDSRIRTLEHTVESLQAQLKQLTDAGLQAAALAGAQLVSGQQMRPVYPPNAPKQMTVPFDTQTAQINATHKTRDIADKSSKKRSRARIQA